MKLQSGLNLFHSKGQIWICLMLMYVRNNYYSAFYWALIGSDLLSCWVHELFIFVLVSLIFIFWIILTLHYPDHSAHSPWDQIMEVWLYFDYYLWQSFKEKIFSLIIGKNMLGLCREVKRSGLLGNLEKCMFIIQKIWNLSCNCTLP